MRTLVKAALGALALASVGATTTATPANAQAYFGFSLGVPYYNGYYGGYYGRPYYRPYYRPYRSYYRPYYYRPYRSFYRPYRGRRYWY